MIDANCLIAAGVPAAYAPALTAACEHYLVNTPARVAGFVAQCRVETGEFASLVEDMTYTHADHIVATFPREVPTLAAAAPLVRNPQALANVVYANRLGNGDVASGDGWKFRGRGLCQLTGRAAYVQAGYASDPDQVAQPLGAVVTAARYWLAHGCNALADAHAWDAITRVWNGPAMLQAARRAALSDQLLRELSA